MAVVVKATQKEKDIKMKKILFICMLLLAVSLVSAHHIEHNEIDYNKVKQLMDSNAECDKLTDEQLEEIGEYYMEQMHPGPAHDMMADMMGLHTSDKIHDEFHINLAKTLYCGDKRYMPAMMGSMQHDMMSGGMMNMGSNMMGSSMMGFGMNGYFVGLTQILIVILLILLIIWLYKNIKKR